MGAQQHTGDTESSVKTLKILKVLAIILTILMVPKIAIGAINWCIHASRESFDECAH